MADPAVVAKLIELERYIRIAQFLIVLLGGYFLISGGKRVADLRLARKVLKMVEKVNEDAHRAMSPNCRIVRRRASVRFPLHFR